MDTREMTREKGLQRWAGTIQERKESGESIEAFCKTRGISRTMFFYWQRKLREARSSVSIQEGAERCSDGKVKAPKGWAVCEAAIPKCRSGIIVEIGSCRIIVERETDMELLGQVCQSLGALC